MFIYPEQRAIGTHQFSADCQHFKDITDLIESMINSSSIINGTKINNINTFEYNVL